MRNMALAIFASIMAVSGAAAQTITVEQPFVDSNGDGRVDFGTANRKAYGVPYVTLSGQQNGKWVYCGPKGCDAPVVAAPVDPWAIAAPRDPLTPAVIQNPKNPGSSLWFKPGSGKRYGNSHLVRAMDAIPYTTGLTDFTLSDVRADAVQELVTPNTGTGNAQTATNVLIERVEAGCGKRCVFIRKDSANWTIRDFRFTGLSANTPYGGAIILNDAAHDVLIERGTIKNFRATEPKGYPNADGIAAERGNYNLTIRYVTITGVTDGPVDSKAANTVLDNVSVGDSRYGFRLWTTAKATTLTCTDVRNACIQSPTKDKAGAVPGRIVIDRLIVIGSGALVRSEWSKNVVIIGSCDLTKWTGKTKVSGAGKVTLGAGC